MNTCSSNTPRAMNIYAIGLIAITVWLTYSSVTSGYFLVHDDYWGFAQPYDKLCDNLMFNTQANIAGRPLGAYIMSFAHSLISTVLVANYVRGISLLLLIACVYILYLWLRRNKVPFWTALFFTAILSTLPAFQSLTYSIIDIYVLVAILQVEFASFLVFYALRSKTSQARKAGLLVAASILMFLALITHGMGAMFFWFLMAISIFQDQTEEAKKHFISYVLRLVPGVAGCLFYVLFFKLTQTVNKSTIISFDFIHPLYFFTKYHLTVIFEFWRRPTYYGGQLTAESWAWGISMLVITFMGCFIGIWKEFRKAPCGQGSSVIIKYLVLCAIFPLTMAPLLVLGNWNKTGLMFTYHHATALTGMALGALFWSLANLLYLFFKKRICDILIPFILVFSVVLGSTIASRTIRDYIVVPHSMELKYIRRHFLNADWSRIKSISYIIPRELKPGIFFFCGFQSRFGVGTFLPAITKTIMRDLAQEIPRFNEVNNKWTLPHIYEHVLPIEYDKRNKTKIVERDTLVIDLAAIDVVIGPAGSLRNEEPSADLLTADLVAIPNRFLRPISGGDYQGFSKESAFDGDMLSSRWASLQTGLSIRNQAYIGIDCGADHPVIVKGLMIRQAGALNSVKLQKSSDGKQWKTVRTISLSVGSSPRYYEVPLDVPGSPSRYWRLLADDDTGDTAAAWAIYELEFLIDAKSIFWAEDVSRTQKRRMETFGQRFQVDSDLPPVLAVEIGKVAVDYEAEPFLSVS